MKTFHALNELDSFAECRDTPQWLTDISKQARTLMQTMEWPTRDDEAWRRTNLNYLDYESFVLRGGKIVEAGSASLSSDYAGIIHCSETEVSQALSQDIVDQGVLFTRLERSSKLPELSDRLSELLLKELAAAEHKISLWHFASITNVYLLYVPRGVKFEKPLALNITAGGDNVLVSPHVILLCEDDSECNLLMDIRSVDDKEFIYNEHVSVSVGKNAKISFMSVNELNLNSNTFSSVSVRVGENSVFDNCVAPFGSLTCVASMHARILGEKSNIYLNGLYCPVEDQHLSVRTIQEHIAPDSYSRTLYKGAIQDEAHSVYQGLIKVAPNAIKTDAYLTNNNILLSDDARSDSIPSLQINTNDVRCSHGSTTGKLSEQQIYYLQSRGYSREEARTLLTRAHFEPVLAGYPAVYVDKIDSMLEGRIYK